MATTPNPKPADIATTLAAYLAADASTTCAILAGMLQSIRLTGPAEQVPPQMAEAKGGVDKLRVEVDKWAKRFRAVNGTGTTGEDPLAAAMAAGKAALAGPAE